MAKKGLLGSLFTISAFTFISRILGLIRDIVFASYFGASQMMDAFNVAFRIPNLFRRFFGEGAFNQSFVPVFSEYYETKRAALPLFVAQVSGTLGIVLLLITILGVLFSDQLVLIFASGYLADPEKFALTSDLVQIMIPYVFLVCMLAMYSSVLNALNKFALPALLPSLLNICLIIGALISVQYLNIPIYGVAYAVIVSGILQCLIILISIHRQGLLTYAPRIDFKAESVRRVILLMLPALIGSSSSQINILINTQLASRLQTGSVTWLYYSDRLVEFALGTVAVALGTVVLPKLSRLNATQNYDAFASTVNWGIRLALILGIPSSIGLIMLAKPLLALLFMRGAFTSFDVEMSSMSLITYGLSIPAYFLIKILAPVYYAKQDTKTPVKFGIIAIVVNIVMMFIFIKPFAHAGLSLSTSIAAWVNAALLIIGLIVLNIHHFKGLFSNRLWIIFPINLGLALILYWIAQFDHFWMTDRFVLRAIAMSIVIILSVGFYFISLHLGGYSLKQLRQVA